MTTKEYLQKGWKIKLRIESKQELITRYRELAQKVTSDTQAERVSSSTQQSKVEKYSVLAADLEKQMIDEQNNLIQLEGNIHKAIQIVQNSELQLILEMRYLRYLHFEEIALKLNLSTRQTYRLHRLALVEISMHGRLHI